MRCSLPLFLLCAACHPLSLYAPPELPTGAPLQLESAVKGKVEVLIDGRGVPHIYAGTIPDAVYGLGFMHGRDRLFQVMLLQHASQGRLTELFGDELLATDRRLRLTAWGLDAQLAALGEDDRRILDAYAAGLTAGGQHAGQSAELALLKLQPPHFSARDALSILRLQAWQLAVDHLDELVRHRLLQQLGPDDPRRALFELPVPTGGVSITGAGDGPAPLSMSGRDGHPGSNSWALDAAHTASGHAVLLNDPHLGHMAPGVFYLAHLETPGFSVAGATLPGAPLVVIGFGKHVAWGMTTSFADAQDLMLMKNAPGRDDAYLLDGEVVPYELVEQKFVLKGETRVEQWRGTRFGPLLPDGYPGARAAEPMALAWGAMQPGALNAELITGFFALAAAATPDDASAAVEKIRGSGQNVLLAFTDGSIAYRLAAFAPLRGAGENGRLPRDGSKSASAFSAFMPGSERPQVTAPATGYLVAANQRVIGDADPRVGSIGQFAVPPSRARRIHERLDALLAAGKPTVEELLAVQQDTISPEARDLVGPLGKLCPQGLPGFCGALSRFDGNFSKDSLTALPFVMFVDALNLEVVRSLGVSDDALARPVSSTLTLRNAVGSALLDGRPQTLVTPAIAERAARAANAELEEKLGSDPARWRYGKLHVLQPKGQLSKAPLFGGFFEAEPHEEGGDGSAIRAEDGLPVTHGACLRMAVELSDPPVGRITLDTGQSGHPRDPHWMDQYADWSNGTPPKLPTARAEVEAATVARIELLP